MKGMRERGDPRPGESQRLFDTLASLAANPPEHAPPLPRAGGGEPPGGRPTPDKEDNYGRYTLARRRLLDLARLQLAWVDAAAPGWNCRPRPAESASPARSAWTSPCRALTWTILPLHCCLPRCRYAGCSRLPAGHRPPFCTERRREARAIPFCHQPGEITAGAAGHRALRAVSAPLRAGA